MASHLWSSVCITLLFMLSLSSPVTGLSDPGDVQNLNAVKLKWRNTPPTWKGSDPCGDSWHGIRCNDSSRVVSLTLSGMNLSGTLAPEIGSLTGLQILDLSYNKLLTGSIPTTLGRLINLHSLVLIGCGFIGNIPRELGNLLALTFLDLSSNNLSGPIPSSMGNLTELFMMDLANNQLSGSLPVSTLNGSGLDNLTKAQHFHLNQNRFSGPIAPDIFHSDMQLIHLLLDSNCLEGNIPSTLGDVQALQVIRLDRNFLEGPIPSNIGKMKNLSELHLSNNKLNGTIPDVSGLGRLQYIDLSNNSFVSSEALKFFSSLEQLTTLIIENGQLTGAVPPSLLRLPQLETIILRNNALNGTLEIDANISPRLQLLDVENNQITQLDSAENTNNPTVFCRLKGNPAYENLSLPATANSCVGESRNHNNDQIYNKSCHNPEARGIKGELVFRSPSFSDIRNKTRFKLLADDLPTQLNLSEVAVSICSVSFDTEFYLNITVWFFPCGKRAVFDRSDILKICSALSQKVYSPPKEFGTFYFIAIEAYYKDHMESPRGLRKNARYGIAFGALFFSLVIAGVAAYAIIQKRRADQARRICTPFASWTGTGPESPPKINGVRSFTVEELRKCTHSFSGACKIGSGGYGTVYKGILPGGNEMVAIKRAKKGSMHGGAEFKNEIELLSRVHHRNLVTLIGFCFDEGEQMIVYEYMPNGSLSQNLNVQSGNFLDWRMRLRIAVGAARGLAYLHEHANPPIIHRDVKSSNILLDEDLNAKVADFGLSKLAGYAKEKNHISTKLKGTLGYMDPEYYMTLQLSEKSDVYSLGVVLLEILTGKQAIEEGKNVVKWVEKILKQEKDDVRALIDPTLGAGSCVDVKSFKSFLNLAVHCVEEWGINRPNMSAVVRELESMLNDVEEAALTEQMKTIIGKGI